MEREPPSDAVIITYKVSGRAGGCIGSNPYPGSAAAGPFPTPELHQLPPHSLFPLPHLPFHLPLCLPLLIFAVLQQASCTLQPGALSTAPAQS